MDMRTGEVITKEELELRLKERPEDACYYKPVPFQFTRKKTGRNETCPCGSGKKFKKCCLFTGAQQPPVSEEG
jgi:uncharacterized protein YecA (UPF0149 family)